MVFESARDAGALELTTKHGQSLIQPGLYGTQRTILHVRNFLEREAVVLLEEYRGALLFRQLRHDAGDGGADLLARDQVLDRLGRRRLARELDQIHPFRRLGDRLPPLAPDPVPAQVQRDAIEPGRELRLPLESTERAEGAEERFLADV